MRLSEWSTGVWPVEDVRLGAESGFFRGQDARAPLFRGCLAWRLASAIRACISRGNFDREDAEAAH